MVNFDVLLYYIVFIIITYYHLLSLIIPSYPIGQVDWFVPLTERLSEHKKHILRWGY